MEQKQLQRIFIFDPCFGGMTGHWENYCKRLYHELAARGYEVVVYGQMQFDAKIIQGVNFKPLFQHSLFPHSDNDDEFKLHTNLFLKDFARITEEFRDRDLFIFHSIFPSTLAAILDWTEEVGKTKKILTSLFFQFPPAPDKKNVSLLRRMYYRFKNGAGMSRKMDWVCNKPVTHYQTQIKRLHELVKKKTHLLFTSTDVLSRNFSALFNTEVIDLPMPGEKLADAIVNAPLENRVATKEFPPIKIGYFGHASLEKGGQFLDFIVKRTLIYYPNAEFILHINVNPDTQFLLKQFENETPNVQCHFGHLEQSQIIELVKEVDIVLMPYSPFKYSTTPSAIFTEALPHKKVFVLPKNTWIHQEAKRYHSGHVAFSHYSQVSVYEALLKSMLELDTLRLRSHEAGKKFYHKNNISNYISLYLEIIRSQNFSWSNA